MERSPYVLLAAAMLGCISSATASGALPFRPQHSAVPARHHAMPQRVIPLPVRQTSPYLRFTAHRPPVVARYVPAPRIVVTYPVRATPLIAATSPAYVAAGALPPAQVIVSEPGTEFPPNWTWTRVDSIAALVPRTDPSATPLPPQLRYYCTDTREYFPTVETCVSPWLKVIP